MSVENARKMLEAVQQEEALLNQITNGISTAESAFNRTVELGKEKGLNFTAEELEGELESVGITVNADGQLEIRSETLGIEGELSEETLEAVAGGCVVRPGPYGPRPPRFPFPRWR